jgi:hypothetical protein
MSPAPLDLSHHDFAALATRVSEEAAAHLRRLDSSAVRPSISGRESLDLFAGPVPERGMGPAALDALAEVALHSRAGNGRFFGYVMAPVNRSARWATSSLPSSTRTRRRGAPARQPR